MKAAKNSRGIRKAKGYSKEDQNLNRYIAGLAHIPGDELVNGDAKKFFEDCRFFCPYLWVKNYS